MTTPARRALLTLTVAWLVTSAACERRSVGIDGDGGVDARARDAALADARPDADAGPPDPCTPDRLGMGFVLGTNVVPTEPEPNLEEYELAGECIHHGAITDPLATNPAFNREVQLLHADGQASVLQYYLPAGLQLPMEVGGAYGIFYRSQIDFGVYRVGVIVTRPTSGLHPLLFVGDAGPFGRAFDDEEPRMSPLKVYLTDTECPVTEDPECPGSQRWQDQLRFDSSTGGVLTAMLVPQAQSAELEVFGDPFVVMNLASWHRDPPCVDDAGYQAIYLAARLSALPPRCNADLFYWWDMPDPELGVGDYCDELFFCVSNASQAGQAELAAPSVSCALDADWCGAGGYRCDFPIDGPIDAARLDEMCAVSVLPAPPERIVCGVYLE